jgi:4-diphosphocytidyl-2-C-methyl-D-erythritol kinase
MLRILVPAKVNLHLRVLAKRPDGYHSIETVFHTIGLWDEIRLALSPRFRFSAAGLPTPAGGANLCVRAYRLLKDTTGTDREASLKLVKRIPTGAGLGGGSADAAACLAGLNRLWNLKLDRGRLAALANRLGSDVSFFLSGGAAVGRGRGEKLSPLVSHLAAWAVVLKPGFGIPTALAYAELDRARRGPASGPSVDAVARGLRTGSLPLRIHNDFEPVAQRLHPLVRRLIVFLGNAGASPAFLTGSGSAVVGVFPCASRALATARTARTHFGVRADAVRLAPFRLKISGAGEAGPAMRFASPRIR